MELATLHLKLSGDPQNTVMIHGVTPAQLAIYAFMHGEECVQSLTLEKVEKKLTTAEVMTKLHETFGSSEPAMKAISSLFPGMNPMLPRTFASIGYDPIALTEEPMVVRNDPNAANKSKAAEKAIREKLKRANAARKAEEAGKAGKPAEVTQEELEDEVDGDDDEEFDDDALDAELAALEGENGDDDNEEEE